MNKKKGEKTHTFPSNKKSKEKKKESPVIYLYRWGEKKKREGKKKRNGTLKKNKGR